MMLLIVAAASACGPYGSFQTFQPSEGVSVSVTQGWIDIWDADQEASVAYELDMAKVWSVRVDHDELVVIGTGGVQRFDLPEGEA
jgi:hypothetical protein